MDEIIKHIASEIPMDYSDVENVFKHFGYLQNSDYQRRGEQDEQSPINKFAEWINERDV